MNHKHERGDLRLIVSNPSPDESDPRSDALTNFNAFDSGRISWEEYQANADCIALQEYIRSMEAKKIKFRGFVSSMLKKHA